VLHIDINVRMTGLCAETFVQGVPEKDCTQFCTGLILKLISIPSANLCQIYFAIHVDSLSCRSLNMKYSMPAANGKGERAWLGVGREQGGTGELERRESSEERRKQ